MWAAAAACCGGADDSVCGAPRCREQHATPSLLARRRKHVSESSGDGVPIAAVGALVLPIDEYVAVGVGAYRGSWGTAQKNIVPAGAKGTGEESGRTEVALPLGESGKRPW